MKTIVIFDLEATCWKDEGIDQFGYAIKNNKISEIIEIGAIRVDKDSGDIVNEFDIFVKPKFNPFLSGFCKNLTSITQEQVDSGHDFPIAVEMFNAWLNEYDDEYIMSWGYYDKNQILREMNNKSVDTESMYELEKKLLTKHLNIKNQFAHMFNVKRCGITKALNILKLNFDGTHHRGIDDSRNIVKIYNKIKDTFFDKIYDID